MALTLGSGKLVPGILRRANDSSTKLSASYEKLSSGLRINKASDDPAGLALAAKTQTDSRLYTKAIQNVNSGISIVSTAKAAASELRDILDQLQDLASLATNGTYTVTQRSAYNEEAQALRDEFNRIMSTTKYNNTNVIDGSSNNTNIQAGITGNSNSLISIGTTTLALAGEGDGTFQTRVSYAAGAANIQGNAIGDLNGDGYDDMIAATSGDGKIDVFINNGDGTFQSRTTLTPGIGNTVYVGLADFNGDGILDIVSSSNSNGNIDIFLGNGSGGFSSAVSFSSGLANGRSFTIGDFTGDGNLDVALHSTSSNKVRIMQGNGDGTFTAAGSFTASTSTSTLIESADFNGDGLDDIVMGGNGSGFNIFINAGSGNFNAATTVSTTGDVFGVTINDFNNDGYYDIAGIGYTTSGMWVALGNGNGTFGTAVSYANTASSVAITSGDFNGDGYADIAASSGADGSLAVFLNAGAGASKGTFGARTTYANGTGAYFISTGDVSGDGIRDIITSDAFNGTVSVFKGNGTTSSQLQEFSLLTTLSAQEASRVLEFASKRLTLQEGKINGQQARLEVAYSNAQSARSVTDEAYARITDVDVAEEVANVVKQQIIQESTTALLAQANLSAQLVVDLLGNLVTQNSRSANN